MLSALFPDIDWRGVQCVGFDLDGTLYDEFDFIDQAYALILQHTTALLTDTAGTGAWMRNRWLEKGSSYPHIFSEAFERFGQPGAEAADFTDRALSTFRAVRPQLALPARNRRLLRDLRERFRLFLVTDGNPAVQRRKFEALGLDAYFATEDIVYTGEHGPEWHKPSILGLQHLALPAQADQIVFFGDRDVDRRFAAAAGFDYVHVYNLIGR